MSSLFGTIGNVLTWITLAGLAATLIARLRGHLDRAARWRDLSDWPLAGMCACFAIAGALAGQWVSAAWFGFCGTVVIWWLWRNRKRRKRGKAKAWLGAKSKALRDALVRKQRQATRPRPVLRPVPQGGVR